MGCEDQCFKSLLLNVPSVLLVNRKGGDGGVLHDVSTGGGQGDFHGKGLLLKS